MAADSYRFDLIEEFDLDVWLENEWNLKRSYNLKIPAWFATVREINHPVLFDYYDRVFIDGEERNEDIFQLSYFRKFDPLRMYFNQCLNIE